ncbi:uncharacterized protein LOC127840600 [Dreissena polymorpha]|uniref:NACHT domain-containing protein n=1 Tax=Dreissena polymorpha TaxID=45954 RepID=A0A9D4MX59_DREPO|nr:uncharacterized protein LOC127840600 [Dreissena polymorpha]KAH3885562.1 hypothetical protein DPMN_009557 [Dreissena polymorpha]
MDRNRKWTTINNTQTLKSIIIEGQDTDTVTSETEVGVTEVNGTVIKGQHVIESAIMEGCHAVTSATEVGATEVNDTAIKGQQVIESVTMEGSDAVTSAAEAGLTEVNATVIKGQRVVESTTMEGRHDINSATEAGVKEVIATTIKGKDVIELATIEGSDAVTSATETGVTEVNATVIKGQQIIKAAILEGRDVITGIKTQKEDEYFDLQCNDLLSRLIDHYRDSVICVPLSTLNPSLDIRVQVIYANPKIHRMKIEKDGKHVKQEQIYKYIDCFCGGFRRLYLQGEPGSGKSFFAAKLVHDWCNVYAPIVKSTKEQIMFGDVDTFQKFRFLFFISLRDSREQTRVSQMIKTQLIYKIYAEDEWESAYKLVLKIMKNIMFLIIQDGLDEWPSKEALPSMDGIPRNQCIVLTTSRPWKLADERIRNSQIDILFHLEGISDPEEFNEKILRCLLDESNDIKKSVKLFKKFLSGRDLVSISSSPMLNTLVVCTWVDGRAKRLTGSSLCELYTTQLDDDYMAERLTGSSLCELYTTLLENLCKKANPQISYFDRNDSPVNCFSRTMYVKPNMEHIDSIAEAAFSFLFSNEQESSLVFSEIHLMAYLSETAKQFALDSGLLSKRKGKTCTDQTLSFIHKTIQEFLTAFHIHMNIDVIDDVISGYLIRNDKSYRDISQMFIFLCGFNISAANKLSTLINELDVLSEYDHYFQKCILTGYKEAVANKNTPIHLQLSHFYFDSGNAKDLMQIWTLNTLRAQSLKVDCWEPNINVTIRSQDASSADCHGPGPVAFPARKDPGPSTLDDEDWVRSSISFIEFDLSLCHNVERLELIGHDDITVQPHALVGLKKLKYLNITYRCKCEALDLSHFEHIESIDLHKRVTLLPLSINNYKTIQCITLRTAYDGLDLSLLENLKSIEISKNVKVLPKPLLIHNKITEIGFRDFDFNSLNNEAIYTWCLLNGADPVQCAGYTPVRPSIERIRFDNIACSSTWLRSLLSTLLTLDHRLMCILSGCNITSFDPDVKTSMQGSDMPSCVEDAASESRIDAYITTDLNNTCTLDVLSDCLGLWEILHGQNVKHLRLQGRFIGLKVYRVPSLSRLLASLSQLETLTKHLSVYIDLQLPPTLKHFTVCYSMLSP